MARRIRHRQPAVKDGRDPLPACVLHDIARCVERTAIENGVSKSWVIADILADYYGIDEQITFKSLRKKGQFGLKMVKRA